MNHVIPIGRQPHIQSPVAQLFFILSSPAKASFNSNLATRVHGQPNLGAVSGGSARELGGHPAEDASDVEEWPGNACEEEGREDGDGCLPDQGKRSGSVEEGDGGEQGGGTEDDQPAQIGGFERPVAGEQLEIQSDDLDRLEALDCEPGPEESDDSKGAHHAYRDDDHNDVAGERDARELFVGVGADLELVFVLFQADHHGDSSRKGVGVRAKELGLFVHPDGDDDGRPDEDGVIDDRNEEEDEAFGVVVEQSQAGPVVVCEEVGDLGSYGLAEDGKNVSAHGENGPHDDEAGDGDGSDDLLEQDKGGLVGEKETEAEQAEVAGWTKHVLDRFFVPVPEGREDLRGSSADIDEHGDDGDAHGKYLDAGEHGEGKVQADAEEERQRGEHHLEVVPMGSSVGQPDPHEDAGNVAANYIEQDLHGEEVGGKLRRVPGEVELEHRLQRKCEEDQRQDQSCEDNPE